MRTAIYAFSGDPITYGHINIIQRTLKVFDRIIVAIGENPDKTYTFNLAEREKMARQCFTNCAGMVDPLVKVISFSNLLIDFAYEQGASVIIKGVRNSADFNYENILHSVGQSQKIGIDTHILFADPELAHISSSTAKAIAQHSGDISKYVPLHVKQAIEERVCKQHIVGITGEIGSGKSHIGKLLAKEYNCMHPNKWVHNIELDHISHDILCKLEEPAYQDVRNEIFYHIGHDKIGYSLLERDGFINRSTLGSIVFNDPEKLEKLNEIMVKPVMVRLRKEISGKKGIILVNCALLAEAHMLHICNNNVILIKVDKDTQKKRLIDRELTEKQIETRLTCQCTYNRKKHIIEDEIKKNQHGKLWEIDNSNNIDQEKLYNLFDIIVGELDVWI